MYLTLKWNGKAGALETEKLHHNVLSSARTFRTKLYEEKGKVN
jgi:hypothetical protein